MSEVISSGTYYVNSGETLDQPEILKTGIVYVNKGGTLAVANIHDGGIVYVNNGGCATAAQIRDGGEEYVLSRGEDMYAEVSSGGKLFVNTGSSYSAFISEGGIVSAIGAKLEDYKIGNGGSMALSGYVHQTSGLVSQGNVNRTTIYESGVMTLEKYAACSNTVISGGKLLAYSGTEAYGIDMYDGYILVDSAYAYDVAISGGSMLVRGNGVLDPGLVEKLIISSGVVWIEAGGVVSNADINSATVRVYKGGSLKNAVVRNSGTVYLDGGEQHGGTVHGDETIGENGTAYNVTFDRTLDLRGSAINCNVASGTVTISGGGFYSGTVNVDPKHNAQFTVLSGGTAKINKVSGLARATLSGGVMDVSAGMLTYILIDNEGGTFDLRAGASIGSAAIKAGVVNVEGVLRDAYIQGGSVTIAAGGVITGKFDIRVEATVTAAAGGIVDFDISGLAAGQSAILNNIELVGGTPDYSLTVGDNQAVGTYKLAGNAAGFNKTLTVKDSAGTDLGTLAVDGDTVGYSGKVFGLKLTDNVLTVTAVNGSSDTVFMGTVAGETKEITSGMSALGATVKDAGVLIIESDGRARNTLVCDGGSMVITSDANISGVTIESGGVVNVQSDGIADTVVVNGGQLYLESAGWAFHYSKGKLVSSGTIVKNGGQLIIDGGRAEGVFVSDGGRIDALKNGELVTARVADGEICAFNGAHVSRVDLEYGGVLNVESGGSVQHINVSSGGVLTGVLREASELTFYGGTLDLDISNAAPGNEYLVDELSYSNINMHPSDKTYYFCTLTVENDQADGMYRLIEGAYDFDKSITVQNTSGEELGTLSIGASVAIGDDLYTLSQDAGNYSLLVTIADNPSPTPPEPTLDMLFLTGDFDGDGKSMLAAEKDGVVKIYSNGAEWGNGLALETGWTVVGTGDFNADKKDDFLRVNTEGYVVGEISQGDGTFAAQVLNLKSAGWSILGTGDFNGNGSDDVLIANPTGASETVGLLGYWESGVTWTLINGYSAEWEMVSTGDFNGDGKCDMLWKNSFVGAGDLTYNAYCTWIVEPPEGQSDWRMVSVANPDEWNFLCSGDFDGNGSHDIAMINDVGVVGIWGVNDGYLSSWSILSAVTPEWTLAGVADFNGDGTDDIAWSNTDTGLTGYWQINNKELTAWANLATIG